MNRLRNNPLIKNSAKLVSGKYIATGIGLLTSILAARLLGAEKFGIAAIILAYPMLIRGMVELKSSDVITRYIVQFTRNSAFGEIAGVCNIGFSIDLIGGIFSYLFFRGLLFLDIIHFNDLLYEYLAVWFAASMIILSISKTAKAILVSYSKFSMLSIIYVIQKALIFLWVVPALLLGYQLPGYIFGLIIANICVGLLYAILSIYTLSVNKVKIWSMKYGSLKSIKKELIQMFGWNYIIVSFQGLINQMPVILLGEFSTETAAGFYKLADTLLSFAKTIENAFVSVTYPIISAYWAKKSFGEVKTRITEWTHKEGFWMFCGATIISIILPFLIPILFGDEFTPMIPGTIVLFISFAILLNFFWRTPFYYSFGYLKEFAIVQGLFALLLIPGGILICHKFGFLGIAILISILRLMSSGYLVKRYYYYSKKW